MNPAPSKYSKVHLLKNKIFKINRRCGVNVKKVRGEFTSFQRKVFKEISKIPLGQTRSYRWVARKIGKPKAIRAVGQALKHNPCPLIIPCHRVIKSDGSLGGYVLGKKAKKTLLKLEKELVSVV